MYAVALFIMGTILLVTASKISKHSHYRAVLVIGPSWFLVFDPYSGIWPGPKTKFTLGSRYRARPENETLVYFV